MNKRNKTWIWVPLLMVAVALTTCTACSGDEQTDMLNGEPQQQMWTLMVRTDKSADDATTRGVKMTTDGLKSYWESETPAEVFNGETKVGTLFSLASETGSTTLSGIINGEYQSTDQLTLYSPSRDFDFSGQDGTPEGMKDYLVGTVRIEEVSLLDRLLTTSNVTFSRLQAFTKFTFDYPVKTLEISGDNLVGSPITVVAEAETTVFYVALRNTNLDTKTTYTFRGRSANGIVHFLGTASGKLKYGKYYEGNVSLNPSVNLIIETPWSGSEDMEPQEISF